MARVLVINKFYYFSGGAERYVFEWSAELTRRGHQVAPFSMHHEKNQPTEWSKYFVENRDFDIGQPLWRKMKIGAGTIWSPEAARRLEGLLDAFRPDICHLHSFGFQLTSSILPVLRKRRIPVVQTSHEYKLICPNQRLYDLERGKLCVKCAGSGFYHAVLNKCLKDSLGASLLACAEGYLNDIFDIYNRCLDRVISPSRFLADLLKAYGIQPEKVAHIPNFVDPARFDGALPLEEPNAGVFFGRLSREKGLDTLLTAAKISGVPVHLIGAGPLEEHLKRRALAENIPIHFRGFVPLGQLLPMVARCGFSIIPSEWYENGPFAALEAMALARPLIVSAIGGLPEFVEEKVTGLTFPPCNAEALAEKMRYLADHPDETRQMGLAARRAVEEKYSLDRHYQAVTAVYSEVLGRSFEL